jgi:hypothetical protein
MRSHTKNKLPRLPASVLKVHVGGWGGFLTIIKAQVYTFNITELLCAFHCLSSLVAKVTETVSFISLIKSLE